MLAAAPSAVATEPGPAVVQAGSLAEDEPNCNGVPGHLPPVPASTAKPLPLRVRVLVEQQDVALARSFMANAVRAYRKINVRLVLTWDTPKTFRAPTDLDGRFASSQSLFDAMRRRYGGERPPGVDAVYLLTRQTPQAQANCIGGILRPDLAFALSPIADPDGTVFSTKRLPLLPIHELGHLMGARHEDANCAESVAATASGQPGCTIMFPSSGVITPTFSILETAFIRDIVTRRLEQRGT